MGEILLQLLQLACLLGILLLHARQLSSSSLHLVLQHTHLVLELELSSSMLCQDSGGLVQLQPKLTNLRF